MCMCVCVWVCARACACASVRAARTRVCVCARERVLGAYRNHHTIWPLPVQLHVYIFVFLFLIPPPPTPTPPLSLKRTFALFTTFSRAVSRCMGAAVCYASLEWVQRRCTELLHAFSQDCLNGSITHTTGRLVYTLVQGNRLFKVMGQETCHYFPINKSWTLVEFQRSSTCSMFYRCRGFFNVRTLVAPHDQPPFFCLVIQRTRDWVQHPGTKAREDSTPSLIPSPLNRKLWSSSSSTTLSWDLI